MAVQWAVGEWTLGLETPLALLGVPLAVGLLAWFVLRARAGVPTDRRTRLAMFGTRTVVVTCLVVAAAGPYTVTTTTAVTDPSVTVLADDSRSMAVFDADVDRLVADIEAAGVPVRRIPVGSANSSRVGDGLVSAVERGGTVLLASDGRVTAGRSLDDAAEFAGEVGATIAALDFGPPATERAVRVAGPPKTTVGVPVAFRVSVDGVATDGSVPVTVAIDGTKVFEGQVSGTGAVTFEHTFERTGPHRVVARIAAADRVRANDAAYRTVRVVDPPPILYVATRQLPFRDLLTDLYDVTTVDALPRNLERYSAVVLQDVPAARLDALDSLREYVVAGNGLVVVGGPNAFENGDYAESALSTLLPVQSGTTASGGTNVVLTVDVSGSTVRGLERQKALALDVLDQLAPETQVGIVAFESRAYRVAELQELGPNRALLEDRIRRLLSGGGTSIAAGLEGASELLGEGGGNVLLLSDGLDDSAGVLDAARALAERDTRVITIGVGQQVDEARLQAIARAAGGSYLRASETSRLRVLFGDDPTAPAGGLTVVDSGHFVTSGVTPTARPSETNAVTVKRGADFLVAAGDGTPAFATWRYGLGQVVTVTAYGRDGTLDGLLTRPNSLLLSRAVNWAIGDPERVAGGLVSLPDTRVGEATTAVFVGDTRPDGTPRFVRTAERRFEATVVPTDQGFLDVLGQPLAVDYPAELSAFGQAPAVTRAVEATGGRLFDPDQAAAIAAFARQQATTVRAVRTDWHWPPVVVAVVVFLLDIAARRLHVYGPGDRIEG